MRHPIESTTAGNGPVDRLLRSIDRVSYWSGHIVSFAILGATVAIITEIVLRYGFGSPTTWGFEAPLYFAAASYLLGGAFAQIDDSHVRVDLLQSRWSPKAKAWVDLLVTAPVFFLGLGILTYSSFGWTVDAYSSGVTSGSRWDPPLWPVRALIPLGAGLLLLQGLASVIRDVQKLRGTRLDPAEEEATDES